MHEFPQKQARNPGLPVSRGVSRWHDYKVRISFVPRGVGALQPCQAWCTAFTKRAGDCSAAFKQVIKVPSRKMLLEV